MFLQNRPRRLRRTEGIRDLVRETELSTKDLILPLFVDERISSPRAISSMPGIFAHTVTSVVEGAKRAEEAGIPAVILFGTPSKKDEKGSEAWNKDGVIQQSIRAIKDSTGLVVIADLCLCEYTSHGHCGVLNGDVVDNDPTIELYALTATSQAEAGADIIAPSGMMDGQVGAIRSSLDNAGFEDRAIMAYSAKYASAYYGPFRDAVNSTPAFGDRRTHQMDPANAREALREMELDMNEGADILMVKPALPYLDIIRAARDSFDLPIAAYNVSGEYAMIMAASKNGWIDEDRAMMESLTCIKRAGADMIITYFAEKAASKMKGIT